MIAGNKGCSKTLQETMNDKKYDVSFFIYFKIVIIKQIVWYKTPYDMLSCVVPAVCQHDTPNTTNKQNSVLTNSMFLVGNFPESVKYYFIMEMYKNRVMQNIA